MMRIAVRAWPLIARAAPGALRRFVPAYAATHLGECDQAAVSLASTASETSKLE